MRYKVVILRAMHPLILHIFWQCMSRIVKSDAMRQCFWGPNVLTEAKSKQQTLLIYTHGLSHDHKLYLLSKLSESGQTVIHLLSIFQILVFETPRAWKLQCRTVTSVFEVSKRARLEWRKRWVSAWKWTGSYHFHTANDEFKNMTGTFSISLLTRVIHLHFHG